MNWLRNEENARQETERKMLNRSLLIFQDEFKEEWKHKKKLMDEHCERLLSTVRERAEAQRHHLSKQYEVERIPPVKYTSNTRDIIKQGKKLAAAECYEDVILLHNRLASGKKLEEQQWIDNIRQRQAAGRQLLEEKIAQEQKSMEEKVAGIRSAFEKQHVKAKDILMQRCKNLTVDMDAAFKREWVQRPEVAISAKLSNKSRIHTSATFRGSLLQQKTLGGSIDLPSVCQLQFGEGELTGTAADYHAVHAFDIYDGPNRPPRPQIISPKKTSPTKTPRSGSKKPSAAAADGEGGGGGGGEGGGGGGDGGGGATVDIDMEAK
jgi:uncharacterized membrane protein YgcG